MTLQATDSRQKRTAEGGDRGVEIDFLESERAQLLDSCNNTRRRLLTTTHVASSRRPQLHVLGAERKRLERPAESAPGL